MTMNWKKNLNIHRAHMSCMDIESLYWSSDQGLGIGKTYSHEFDLSRLGLGFKKECIYLHYARQILEIRMTVFL